MFKNFWYAVEFSADLVVGKPEKVKVLGQQLVIYRKPSDGSVVAMSDLCVHRGAALSGGTVKGDCIVCPYHGWEYEPDGAVQKIPAHPEQGHPAQGPHRRLPGQSRSTCSIWVFMGDLPEEERPPIPDWSAVDDTETFRAVTGEFLWKSNYERILENGVDIAHTPFVHAGAFGNPEQARGPGVRGRDLASGTARRRSKLNPPRADGHLGQDQPATRATSLNRPPVPVSTTWWLPNMILLEVGLPMGELKIFDINIPIDEKTTLVKFVALRTFFKGKWADKNASAPDLQGPLRRTRPSSTPCAPSCCRSTCPTSCTSRATTTRSLYRRRRQELIETGWSVEGNTIVGEGPARVEARVIPSPTRRRCPSSRVPGTSRRSAAGSCWSPRPRGGRRRRRRRPRPTPDVEDDAGVHADHGGHGSAEPSRAASASAPSTRSSSAPGWPRSPAPTVARSAPSPRRCHPSRSARCGSSRATAWPRSSTSGSRCRRSASTATWCSRSPPADVPVPHFTLDSVQGQGSLRLPPRPDPAGRPRAPTWPTWTGRYTR